MSADCFRMLFKISVEVQPESLGINCLELEHRSVFVKIFQESKYYDHRNRRISYKICETCSGRIFHSWDESKGKLFAATSVALSL